LVAVWLVESEADPATATLPETFPAVVGVNSTPKFVLWPGARLTGSDKPVMLKLALLTEA
jgi:hypothetical protein